MMKKIIPYIFLFLFFSCNSKQKEQLNYINSVISDNNENIHNLSERVYTEFEMAMSENPEKVKFWNGKATEIKLLTEEKIKLFESYDFENIKVSDIEKNMIDYKSKLLGIIPDTADFEIVENEISEMYNPETWDLPKEILINKIRISEKMAVSLIYTFIVIKYFKFRNDTLLISQNKKVFRKGDCLEVSSNYVFYDTTATYYAVFETKNSNDTVYAKKGFIYYYPENMNVPLNGWIEVKSNVSDEILKFSIENE